ncbi:hypothetical protein K8Z61_06220 [Nocardioides sp. TRM66260-LWL]|uniref:hypothetical protein n=1 Tax=Nocardioides sp. TRM66260-LWL TaxID=2874478 RepID=UPI001CC45341|nr:hypothetical protein [Nocardioides sp. TRM66260-LWL]MBZ5734087.1 hypothetical protein [Nocardioides sp. TRM66260-LWL]
MSSRTTRTLGRAAAATATLALLAAGTVTAHADAYRHRDATGDVTVTSDTAAQGTRTRVDPGQRNPDLTNLTIQHTRYKVTVATAARAYGGIDDNWHARIVTSKGDRFDLTRSVSTGAEDPSKPFIGVTRNGYRVSCDGIVVSRTSSGVIAQVPTRCLGRPWKVRAGVVAQVYYRESGEGDQSGRDDVLRDRAASTTPALSPWVLL